MKLKEISLKDKAVFKKYLSLSQHGLSAYAFENIYIWKGLSRISWSIIEGSLCVFFRDKIGSFLYLPPLGNTAKPQAVKRVFEIMDKINRKNTEISRIENAEQDGLSFYRSLGYEAKSKFNDYLFRRSDLAQLCGGRFRHKRSAANFFNKHYKFTYAPFSLKDRKDCLRLYAEWMRLRKNTYDDALYQGMCLDSFKCLKVLLDNYADLNVIGRVVKIDKELKAFTFGFKLNSGTLCVLYEITDLAFKGLAQFIFREFCRELTDYKYINIMDDSGLDNLKKVKLSYRPYALVPAYIISRKNC